MVSSNLILAVDAFALVHFAVSYYRNCYRRGFRIDFWHAELFFFCVLPNMLMLPFAMSDLNVLVLGEDLSGVMQVLPRVFLITVVGYFAVIAGGGLWRLRSDLGLRRIARQVLDSIPRCSMMLMSSRSILVFHTALCLLLQFGILTLYIYQNGFGFDLRGFTFANPSVRPVALLISNYSIIIGSHCLARYLERREKSLLACTLLLTFGLIFFGSRENILGIYLNVLICYMVFRRKKISLFRLVTLAGLIVGMGLYLGNVRTGAYSLSEFVGSLAVLIFYGDTFSDLRDFAWVYSGWKHSYWGGKTYLAALTAFIPRFASQFRDTWGLGVQTASTVGFDPQVHPGLRPGAFGESFFNFGILGVIAMGVILGIIFRRVDLDVKDALLAERPSMTKAFAPTNLLTLAGCIAVTAGFSTLYVLAGVYAFSWFCLSVHRVFHPRPIAVSES